MNISNEKLKRSAIVSGLAGVGASYSTGAIMNNFQHFKEYRFQQFSDAAYADLLHPIQNISTALSNDLFIQSQAFIILGSCLLFGKMLFEKDKKYEDASKYGAYGTSRWANDSEIFKKENITTDLKNEGTLLGFHKKKPVIQHQKSFLNKNNLVVGGSGAGKTRSFIIPNILKNENKSIVVIDPKGELYEKTSQIKREQGYEVHLINFKNRDISDRYNLFDYLRRDSDAFKIADTMVNNAGEGSKIKKDFWNQAQTSVLQALILYVKYALPPEKRHMGSVMSLGQVQEEELKALFEQFEETHVVKKAFNTAISNLKEKTMSDVFVTLMQTLNPWQYDDVCSFTATNDFLFEELGTKKMIVYVIMPIADNEFRPLITTFFSQMFSELYRLADQHYGTLPKGVLLMLDEFANIGKIPNFEERLSTTRSLGIEVTIVLQDTAQLEKVYGKELAKEIINNCDFRLLLKANEYETAKYFSQLAGKTTIRVKNESNSKATKSTSKSESISYMGRDLITPDEIMRLENNEVLLFLSGQYPMKITKAWFDQIKHFKNMLGKEVSRDEYPMVERGQYVSFSPPPKTATGFLGALDEAIKEVIPEDPDLLKEAVRIERPVLVPDDPIEEKEIEPAAELEPEKIEEEKPNDKEISSDPNELEAEHSEDQNPAVKEETFDALDDMMKNFKF